LCVFYNLFSKYITIGYDLEVIVYIWQIINYLSFTWVYIITSLI